LPFHRARLSSRLPDRVRSDHVERAKDQDDQPDKVEHFKQIGDEKRGRIQIAKWSEDEFEILDSVNLTNGQQTEVHRGLFGESADGLS
jgi:hypothetical protein